MSVKYFCDGCGKEVERGAGNVFFRKLDNVAVEVRVIFDAINTQHVCISCMLKVVTNGREVNL